MKDPSCDEVVLVLVYSTVTATTSLNAVLLRTVGPKLNRVVTRTRHSEFLVPS
jgi:hypothetical protein